MKRYYDYEFIAMLKVFDKVPKPLYEGAKEMLLVDDVDNQHTHVI